MSTHEEHLTAKDYSRLCALIYRKAGIHLGADRRTMLGSRVTRRMRALNLNSYADYCSYLFGVEGQREEIPHFIDVVTTNKTDFFREPAHFDFLIREALPRITASRQSGQPALIWSAGCSTGEEPYTLTMVLSEYAQTQPGFRFRVLATDVSNTVLAQAAKAVYSSQIVAPISPGLQRKYLLRSRDRSSEKVRIVPELRRLVEFRHLNFMDDDYGVPEMADAIFCRNVLIYFDRPTQEKILSKLADHLLPDGYLFVGHAESLHAMNLPLKAMAPATYRKLSSR